MIKHSTLNFWLIFLLAIVTLISAVLGEIVSVEKCGKQEQCNIEEVRVTPCSEAAQSKPCKTKRGKTAYLEVDFVPNFASTTLHCQAYWDNGIIDLPLTGMENDGCKTTNCPLVSGNKQTYKYDLVVSKMFPTGVYPVKWVMKGEKR